MTRGTCGIIAARLLAEKRSGPDGLFKNLNNP
jgi:hypothetical protein